ATARQEVGPGRQLPGQFGREELLELDPGRQGRPFLLDPRQPRGDAAGQEFQQERVDTLDPGQAGPPVAPMPLPVERADDLARAVQDRRADPRGDPGRAGPPGARAALGVLPEGPPLLAEPAEDPAARRADRRLRAQTAHRPRLDPPVLAVPEQDAPDVE